MLKKRLSFLFDVKNNVMLAIQLKFYFARCLIFTCASASAELQILHQHRQHLTNFKISNNGGIGQHWPRYRNPALNKQESIENANNKCPRC